MTRRRIAKHTREQIREIDYMSKLSPAEREYLLQFLMEYYQADLAYENPIHPDKYIKDCRDRNNASRRQLHSVGSELLGVSVTKVREAQHTSLAHRYYVPEDHFKDLELEAVNANK